MFVRSTIVVILLALCATNSANAALWNSPIKSTVDQAVQDAVGKLLNSIGNVAGGIHNNVGQTVGQATQAFGAVTQPIATAVGQMGMQAVNDYSAMGSQIKNHYTAMGQQFVSHLGNMGGYLGGATDQLEAVMDAYQAQFCTPASFRPGGKKPAKFVGPSIALELSSGGCSFNETAFIYEDKKQLNCTEPAITYTKVPASFTSKHKSPPAFKGKECVVAKEFGETIRKVLFVFDGQSNLDPTQLTNQIVGEMKSLLGSVTSHVGTQNIQAQMQQFLSGLNLQNSYTGATGTR